MENTHYHFTTQDLSLDLAQQMQGLVELLNQPTINLRSLKAYLAQGIPEQATILREYCWKIVLGYLPVNKNEWHQKILEQQTTYRQFVEMFLSEQKFSQYPMTLNKRHERWPQLHEDFNLWEQIEKDTSRTHGELSFFCMPAQEILVPYLTNPRKEKFKQINGEDHALYKQFMMDKSLQRTTYRYDYMSRILYIYSKLNPRIQYVQGMNEILAPIFYLVNAGKSADSHLEEASCFFMFHNAISDIIELHIKDLDKSQNGIYEKLNKVNQMLVVIEPEIWHRLNHLKVDPIYYCFRWITLIFAQDFPLFETLRIWESVFSATDRLQYLDFLVVSVMVLVKQFILQSDDFSEVLCHLQNIRDNINVVPLLALSDQLYDEFRGIDFHHLAEFTKQTIKARDKNLSRKKKSHSLAKWKNYLRNIIE